jgi:hypothetical protein
VGEARSLPYVEHLKGASLR